MIYEKMNKQMNELVEEYFVEFFEKDFTINEKFNDYRKRLRSFISDNNVPESILEKIDDSGMGESFYMAHGYGILSEEGLV